MAKTVGEMELRDLIGVSRTPDRPAPPYAANARWLSSLDGFNIKRPPIPPHVFVAERDRALRPGAPTGLVALDLSGHLGLSSPATTPLILARYARIRPGEHLTTKFRASTEFHYVMRGTGRTTFGNGGNGGKGGKGREPIDWVPGDVFCLPGGMSVRHEASQSGAVLWIATNEPLLAHEHCPPPTEEDPPIEPVHYPAEEIRRRLLGVHLDPRGAAMTGKSVNFGNIALDADRIATDFDARVVGPGPVRQAEAPGVPRTGEDRKSTRLNSSH